MKKQLLSGLAALSMVAFGCSDEPGINQGGEPGHDVTGYVVLQISSTSNTRTTGTPTEPGIAAENAINTVDIVLAKENGEIAVVLTPTFNNGVSEPFKVATGTHYVYALVNKPAGTNLTVGENIQRVIAAANEAEVAGGLGSDGATPTPGYGFFMANQRNKSTEQAGVPVTVTAGNTQVQPAKATIYVDRAAVKIEDVTGTVTITDLASYSTFFDGVSVKGFVPLNVNKQYNLIQDWGTGNGSGTALTEEVLYTPLYSTTPDARTRVADQFFYNISSYADPNVDKTTEAQFVKGPVYTTENRPTVMFFGVGNTSLTAGRGETTGVIYRVQTTLSGANASTFYVYNGVAHKDLVEIQKDFQDPLPTDAPSLRELGIKVYENGVMYYTYFILDPNTEHQYIGENYYAVMRNSIYRLSINKLAKLGDDIPGGGTVDPTQPGEPENPPIDTDEAYLEVTLRVNPWILNTISIDF